MSAFKPKSAWRLTRTGPMSDNVNDFSAMAEQFAASITKGRASAAFVIRKSGSELRDYLLVSRTGMDAAAAALANATGARAEAINPDLVTDGSVCDSQHLAVGTGSLAFAQVHGDGIAGRSKMEGVDPSATARQIKETLIDGEEIIVSMTGTPRRVARRWNAYAEFLPGNSTHHTVKTTNKILTTIAARADDPVRAEEIVGSLLGSVPGWDFDVDGTDGSSSPIPKYLWLAAAAAAFWYSRSMVGYERWGLLVLAAVGVLAFLAGFVPGPVARMARAVDAGRFPLAPTHQSSGQRFHSRLISRMPERYRTSHHVWPLGRYAIPSSAPILVPLVAPQSGSASGASATREHPVPPELDGIDGPPLFTSEAGDVIRLDGSRLWSGIACVGEAGSGKSVFNQSMFAYLCTLKATGRKRVSILAVETKTDGVTAYETMGAAAGQGVAIVELADESNELVDAQGVRHPLYHVDMFNRPGATILERAEMFADAMGASFDDGSVGNQSRETIVSVVTAGMAFTDYAYQLYEQRAGQNNGVAPLRGHNWFHVADALLGDGYSEESGKAIYSILMEHANTSGAAGQAEAMEGVRQLANLYGPNVSPSSRRGLTQAPRNKFAKLRPVANTLAPANGFTLDSMLEQRGVLVIGTGTSRSGRQVPADVTEIVTAMIGFTSKQAVERCCAGWQARGESIAVMCDEFKHFAGYAPQEARWWKDDGRSFGVIPLFATQYPNQIQRVDPALLTSFMSYGTFLSFRQTDVDTASAIANQVSRGVADDFTAADVVSLPEYTAVIATNAASKALPAFTAKSIFSIGNPAQYVAMVKAQLDR